MSHSLDAICEHGTVHGRGCPERGCETDDGRSPHGSSYIDCPTPDVCAVTNPEVTRE